MDPALHARRNFRKWFGITLLWGSLTYATLLTQKVNGNPWFSRPDLNVYPAMVEKEMTVAEKQMYESCYAKYRKEKNKGEFKRSTLYRLFFPSTADFTIKENPWMTMHRDEIFDATTGKFPRITNRFADHEQK